MSLEGAIEALSRDPNARLDVAQIALWIAKDEYPSLDVDGYLSELRGMARDAQRYVRGSLEARVAGLRRYLFHEMGFRGNLNEYYDPRNSYLNDVIDRRLGIPISLAVVAISVGERTGLPLAGVALPGHFVLRAEEKAHESILIDPFHGGRTVEISECVNLVRNATGKEIVLTEDHLRPASMQLVVGRMLSNLKAIYWQGKDYLRAVRIISRLVQLYPAEVDHQRDLGIAYLAAGKPGLAVAQLRCCLRRCPDSKYELDIRRHLVRAGKLLGQLN